MPPGAWICRFQTLRRSTDALMQQCLQELAAAEPRPRWIVVAAEPITDVDTTAADMLKDLGETLNGEGISLVFAEMKDPVRAKIERYELTRTIDPTHFFPTIESAVTGFPRSRSRLQDGSTDELRADPEGD